MDFELQPQQAHFRDLARQVAHDHLAAYAATVDREGVFPAASIAAVRAAGLLDLLTPAHYGGAAVDWQTFVQVMAEIGGACGSTGLIAIMHCAAMMLLAIGGRPAQQEQYFRAARAGALWSVSFSEAGSGAQFMRPTTVARQTESGYVLSGRKAFCTSAGTAQYLIISTLVAPDQATLFIVEQGRAGLTVAPTWDAMGMRASASHDLVFEGYQAAAHERLGGEGAGGELGRLSRPPFVLGFAATYLGIAEAAAAYAMEHARTRRRQPENLPLSSYEGIRFMVADMDTALLAGRLALQRAAWAVDSHQPDAVQAMTEAVALCTTNAVAVCHQALQVCGGHGYLKRAPVERYYRDVRAGLLMVGSAEGTRDALGAMLLDL